MYGQLEGCIIHYIVHSIGTGMVHGFVNAVMSVMSVISVITVMVVKAFLPSVPLSPLFRSESCTSNVIELEHQRMPRFSNHTRIPYPCLTIS